MVIKLHLNYTTIGLIYLIIGSPELGTLLKFLPILMYTMVQRMVNLPKRTFPFTSRFEGKLSSIPSTSFCQLFSFPSFVSLSSTSQPKQVSHLLTLMTLVQYSDVSMLTILSLSILFFHSFHSILYLFCSILSISIQFFHPFSFLSILFHPLILVRIQFIWNWNQTMNEPNDERTKRSETGMTELGTAGEKVTLGISILLSLVVFLLLVSKILPPTSLVLPLIAKYLLFTFVMNCISILATVIIINWNFRGPRTHKMPNWVRTVFLKYLPIVLLIRRPKKTRLRWMMDMPSMGVHYHPYDHQQQMMQQQSSPLYPLSPPGEQGMNTNNGFSNNMVNTGSSCKDGPSFNNFRSRKESQVVLDYSCLDVPSPPVPTSFQHTGQQMVQHHPSCTISQGHLHHRAGDHLIHQTASSSTASPLGLAASGLVRPINGNGGDARRFSLDGGGGGGGAACEGIPKMMMGEGEDDSVDTLYLTPEAYRATEAIEFIAGHLRSEDEYIQVRLNLSFSPPSINLYSLLLSSFFITSLPHFLLHSLTFFPLSLFTLPSGCVNTLFYFITLYFRFSSFSPLVHSIFSSNFPFMFFHLML